jgi:hypothetical protein
MRALWASVALSIILILALLYGIWRYDDIHHCHEISSMHWSVMCVPVGKGSIVCTPIQVHDTVCDK